jgi:hypothetical protein
MGHALEYPPMHCSLRSPNVVHSVFAENKLSRHLLTAKHLPECRTYILWVENGFDRRCLTRVNRSPFARWRAALGMMFLVPAICYRRQSSVTMGGLFAARRGVSQCAGGHAVRIQVRIGCVSGRARDTDDEEQVVGYL